MAQKNSKKLQVNQGTTISIPKVEYITTDKKMWDSIKRRVEISDKIFDFKDIVFVFIGAIFGGGVSFFSVDEKLKSEYFKWLILLSIIGFISLIILFWMKKQKKEFTNTIYSDMCDIEN